MNRSQWRIAAGFVSWAGITALALFLGLGVFGPKPGAPEGVRLHETVANWPMIVVVICIAGAIGASVAGAPRAAGSR